MAIKNKIKILREITGAGVLDCKNAILLSNLKFNEAIKIIRKKDLVKTYKILANSTKENIISNYCHHNSSLGVLLKISCQTDFVAKNKKFQDLGCSLAKQIAVLKEVEYLSFFEVPKPILISETLSCDPKKLNCTQNIINNINFAFLKLQNIAYNIKPKILLKQSLVFQKELNIENYIINYIAIFGENISIKKFIRYSSKEE